MMSLEWSQKRPRDFSDEARNSQHLSYPETGVEETLSVSRSVCKESPLKKGCEGSLSESSEHHKPARRSPAGTQPAPILVLGSGGSQQVPPRTVQRGEPQAV